MRVKPLIAFLLTLYLPMHGWGSKSFSTANGLSNGSVKAIWQDDTRFVWIGTKNGLNRFDGYEFTPFYYDGGGTLAKNDIVSITPDKDNRIWIGTFDGVVLFDFRKNVFIDPASEFKGDLPTGVVVGTYVRGKDDVWVATKKGLYHFIDGSCSTIEAFKNHPINSMGWCGDDGLLLDIIGEGLFFYNIKSGDWNEVKTDCTHNRNASNCILYDGQSATWLFSNDDEILRYDRINGNASMLRGKGGTKTGNQIHAALNIGKGVILIGADSGLLRLDIINGEVSHALVNSSMPESRRIMSLFRDNLGTLWLGTFENGFRLYNKNFDNIHPLPLSVSNSDDDRIIPNLIEAGGKIIISCHNKISLFDSKTANISVIHASDFPGASRNSSIHCVDKLYGDRVFVYILNLGSFLLDIGSGKITKIDTGLDPASQIRKISQDAEGNIWAAADELYRFNLTRDLEPYHFSTNESGFTRYMLTQTLFMEKDGSMLVGTRNNGLWRYAYSNHSGMKYADAIKVGGPLLEKANVVFIHIDNNERIWIGTFSSGLFVCNRDGTGTTKVPIYRDRFHYTICGIAEDSEGYIWVSSYKGITRIDPITLEVLSYDENNGYPLKENSLGALLFASDSRLYVGGDNKICSANPKDLFQHNQVGAKAVFCSINRIASASAGIDGIFSPDELANPIFDYKNNSLSIKVSSLRYLYQSACKYSYLLDNSHEWMDVEQNDIKLSNLSYGRHILVVRSSDEFGIWSDETSKLVFKIRPPVWLSTPAIVLYILLGLLFIFFSIRFLFQWTKDRDEKLVSQIEKDNMEKAYKLRMDLFTQFSHELRTPLTLIKDPVEEILSDTSLPEKYKYPLIQVEKNANKMLLLVDQLLDIRRLEHGGLRLNLSKVDCKTFIKEQVENYSDVAKRRSIKLTYHCKANVDDLWGDVNLLERVVANLISNAIKNTSAGGKISVEMIESGKDKVRISVKDNGIGIVKENMEKIFEPFYQVQSNRAKVFGSGIGLTLARHIVSLHKAQIWVESEVGKGSTFIVELYRGLEHFDGDETIFSGHNFLVNEPVSSIQDYDTDKQYGKESPPKSMVDKPSILIVDDDNELRGYLCSQLRKVFNIREAQDGEQGLVIANKILPDLIISDVMMPNMDGIEFCHHIKEGIATSHIPVILLTAKSEQESIEQGYDVLADDYILKPFTTKV